MKVWKLKSCPRCRGDLFMEKDHYGWYEQCLQCGFLKDLDTIYESGEKGNERVTKWERHRKKTVKSCINKGKRKNKEPIGSV